MLSSIIEANRGAVARNSYCTDQCISGYWAVPEQLITIHKLTSKKQVLSGYIFGRPLMIIVTTQVDRLKAEG